MNNPIHDAPTPTQALPAYVAPKVTVYTSQEILDQVGPALTCSILPCPTDAG